MAESCPINFRLPMEAHGTVKGLQTFLNSEIAKGNRALSGVRSLVVDGKCGPLTWAAWNKYITALAAEKGLPPPGSKPPVILPFPPQRVPPIIDKYGGYPDGKPPIYKEPWFWFVAASALVLIIALRSGKRR